MFPETKSAKVLVNSVLVDVELIRNHFSANATAGAITFDFLIRPEAMKRIVSISQP
jgi:hypothetical protein